MHQTPSNAITILQSHRDALLGRLARANRRRKPAPLREAIERRAVKQCRDALLAAGCAPEAHYNPSAWLAAPEKVWRRFIALIESPPVTDAGGRMFEDSDAEGVIASMDYDVVSKVANAAIEFSGLKTASLIAHDHSPMGSPLASGRAIRARQLPSPARRDRIGPQKMRGW